MTEEETLKTILSAMDHVSPKGRQEVAVYVECINYLENKVAEVGKAKPKK